MTKDIEPINCTLAVHPETWKTVEAGAACYRMQTEDFFLLAGYLFAKEILADREATVPRPNSQQCEGSAHD